MTSREIEALARRTIAVGFAGATPADAPLAALRAFRPGGVVLFGRNAGTTSDLSALVAALREGDAPPPLIAIDQEGGRVARLRSGVTPLPSAMALGALASEDVVERLGAHLGADLARIGISVDFAPVADLALHDGNTVIGTRAYAASPDTVGLLAAAMARGLAAGGVAAAVKHFPGHGDTAVDSHLTLPRLATPLHTWRKRELAAFERVLAARPALLMTAHVVVEALDPHAPATMSRRVLEDVVRGDLGYEGVIVTDCLQMSAIGGGIGTAQAAWRAMAAGADLLLISHDLDVAEAAVAAIVAAVERGDVHAVRLREAVERVDALRLHVATLRPRAPDGDGAALALQAAASAVTVPRERPLLRDGVPATIVSFEGTVADGVNAHETAADASLRLALRHRRVRAESLRVPLEPDAADVGLLLAHLELQREHDVLVLVRRADLHPAQHAAVARILGVRPNAIVASVREPYDALSWPQARFVAATCGDDPLALEGLAEVLMGRIEPAGTLPVPIAERAAVG